MSGYENGEAKGWPRQRNVENISRRVIGLSLVSLLVSRNGVHDGRKFVVLHYVGENKVKIKSSEIALNVSSSLNISAIWKIWRILDYTEK